MHAIRSLCGHIVVLDAGRVIASGTPEEALADADVMRVYLGESALAADGTAFGTSVAAQTARIARPTDTAPCWIITPDVYRSASTRARHLLHCTLWS